MNRREAHREARRASAGIRQEAGRLRRLETERLRLARKWEALGADLEAMELLYTVTSGWPSAGVVALRYEIDEGIPIFI